MPRPIILLLGLVGILSLVEAAGGWQNLALIVLFVLLACWLLVLLLRQGSRGVGNVRAPPSAKSKRGSKSPAEPMSDPVASQRISPHSPVRTDAVDPVMFADLVAPELLHRSGSVFYSGRAAFREPSRLYILGLNPGGSPQSQADETIERDIREWLQLPELWSAYSDESWQGRPPGRSGMQPRILHLLKGLGLDARLVPASNVVFVRSSTEAALATEKSALLPKCWRVHEAVINRLGVDTVLCLGNTAGSWVRVAFGAKTPIDQFVETNSRGWRSFAHVNRSGDCVVTLTHPGRADWRNPEADPTPLVERALARRR